MFIRFYAWGAGLPRLVSAPYPLYGPDEFGGIWVRSSPSQPDSANFALPRGAWQICATATDTTGRNESPCSDTISVYSDPGVAPMRVQVRFTRNYIGPVLKRGMPVTSLPR